MDIDVRIREKLNKYNLGDLKDFDDKTIKRLYEIENFLYNMEVNAKKLEEELKGLKPNITNITSSKDVSITRKTAYNNKLLKEYIEGSIKDFPDYTKENEIKKMKDKYSELTELYNKVIDNIIDNYNKNEEIEELKNQIEILKNENSTLREIITENDRKINNSKKRSNVASI